MLKIAVLASGGLGLKAVKHLATHRHNLTCVFTDKQSVEIIAYCKQQSIPFFAGNPRGGKGRAFIKQFEVEVIASVNYLFLIESDIIEYPSRLIFNIHGSLLPKYRGRTPHVWAIINGEEETGITAHLIDANCDTGAIIKQLKIPIEKEATGAMILEKFNALYLPLIDEVLQKLQNNQLNTQPQNEALATYFRKRTPESGLIDWTWDAERIRNWVRAQANPYPGAFSFIGTAKITIDKVAHTNAKMEAEMVPGQLQKINNEWIVQTGSGLLTLVNIRTNKHLLAPKKIFNQ